ncbi:type i restriction-modification system methyltransferase subunit [Haloferax elongans ATCC BAA-1513]|uniref:Type i restriction-modification system methyltransferase subunit n=1 Tax=Haloferax elongans ATCC BAA-1513 TaxID=1230453 RepID=M0HB47_HALEO|nr:N-6 DNA methylase [Haloferax elongans]ELZ81781.1 type i restriction-modification system methyltransferase subunit [Haloferax elongans ATCC BAA-1513]
MSEESTLIDAIFQGGDAIYAQFEPADSDIEARLNDWTSYHGLDRTEKPLLTVARQAAFNVLLKSTLYSQYRLDGYELKSLNEDNDIRECFAEAKSIIGNNAFKECILDEVAFTADTDTLREIIELRQLLVDADDPAETIGWLFESIILQESRRKLGQFRTPEHVAEVLSNWAITSADDTVFDPGMGAGALTARAYKRKQSHCGKSSVREMYGVDVNPLAVVMSTTAIKLINGDGTPNFYHRDFLEIDLPESKGHISKPSPSVPEKMDSLVSNPPYSRHHELSQEDKAWIKKKVQEEAGGLSLSGQSPMYLYFYIHATQFLKQGGRMAFLTPSEFLETNYGTPLKEYLLDNFNINAVILHDHDSLTFEDVHTTSCITLLERQDNPNEKNHTRFIELDKWPDADDLVNVIETGASECDFGTVWVTEQGQLDPDEKWTKYFDPDPVTRFPDLKPLSDIGSLKRGIATGNNDYFCLTDKQVEKWDIDDQYLSPLIRNATSVEHYDCTQLDFDEWRKKNKETWLLYHVNGETSSLGGDGVREYLKSGLKQGADESYLAQSRAVWYRVDRREPADVWATYMTQSGFRFIHNKTDARNLNNLHSIYFEDYSDRQIRAICAYLNSNIVDQIVAQSGRTYAQGLQKIEPNELKQIPVIDPNELTNTQVSQLAELFDQLCKAARTEDEDETTVMAEIDEYLSQILNSHKEEVSRVQSSVD